MRGLAVRLSGTEIDETDDEGEPVSGDTLFLMFNAHHDATRFFLPRRRPTEQWERLLDTSQKEWGQRLRLRITNYTLPARSVAVFRLRSRSMRRP